MIRKPVKQVKPRRRMEAEGPMRKWMILAVLVYLAATPAAQEMSRAGANWFSYGGDPGGTRYSSLRQITKANVSQLKEVWRFETPEAGRLQTTPLIVDGTMYVVTPRQKVVALDAATGQQKWTFDSGAGDDRGVARADVVDRRQREAACSALRELSSTPSIPRMARRSRASATMAASICGRTCAARPRTIRITRPRRP